MSKQPDVLRFVVARLETAPIRYMLVGAMAMSYCAQPRTTRDIDLVVDLEPAQTDTLHALL
ncbi:MAG TPA: hypothetical protein VGK32_03380 [Vicinamibacterales bacterium]